MPSFPGERLIITDGTTSISIVNRGESGFLCTNWVPSVAEPKGGGSWRDSPLAEGRTLAYFQYGNVIDQFDILATGLTQDALTRDVAKLRFLLNKARKHWVTTWQGEPVWIEARGRLEANTRYAIIIDYRTPVDGMPYEDPFAQFLSPRAAFDPWPLTIEHTHWQESAPGTSTCVELSAEQEDWHYEADWNANTNQPATHCYVIYGSEVCGYLFAGGRSAVWRTNNPSIVNNWTTHALGATATDPYGILRATNGTMYVSGYDIAGATAYTFSSTDCGNTWALFNPGGVNRGTTARSSLCMGGDTRIYLVTGNTLVGGNSVLSVPLVGAAAWTVEATSVAWDQVTSIIELGANDAVPGRQIIGTENSLNDGEVWITDDYWTTRERVWVFSGEYITYLFVTADSLILGGTSDGNIYSSVDGTQWELQGVVGGIAGLVSAIDQDDNGIIKCSTQDEHVTVSGDGGHSWDDTELVLAVSSTYGLYWSSFLPTGGQWFCGVDSGAGTDIYALDNIVTVGRSATCDDEVFAVNHRSELNVTHVKVFDATAAPPNDYVDEFPAAAFSFDLLPAAPAINDAVYFCIDTALQTNGDPPLDNLVFDIDTPAYDLSLRWEYYNGAWAALDVQDGTDAGGGPFTRSGVNNVSWGPPSDWTTLAVDGVTGLWVRCFSYAAVGANPVAPTQQNRNVYTVNWPRVDIDDAQVPGTLMALARHILTMRSDEDGYASGVPDLYANRVMMGLRQIERGGIDCSDFTAYLNCADEQNPVGIACSLGGATSFIDFLDHAPGRVARYAPSGVESMAMRVRFELEGTLARQFHGKYRAFARVRQYDGDLGTITMRLYVGSPWGADEYWSKIKTIPGTDGFNKLIDFGEIELPLARVLTPSEYPSTTSIELHAACTSDLTIFMNSLGRWMSSTILAPPNNTSQSGISPTDFDHWTTNRIWYDMLTPVGEYPEIYFLDFILLPTDEWFGDYVDDVLSTSTPLQEARYLELDSIANPRERLRPLIKNAATDGIAAVYEPQSPGPVLLQPQADQRLWYLFDRSATTGIGDWDASSHILLSGQTRRMARYLGMRGDQ